MAENSSYWLEAPIVHASREKMESRLHSTILYYCHMMLEQEVTEAPIACSEHLDRSALNYGLESLEVVDNYLMAVHMAQNNFTTIEYANTVLGTAIYFGEVIRRNLPLTEWGWGRLQALNSAPPDDSLELSYLSDLIVRCSATGAAIYPVDPVIRRIRHGAFSPSIKVLALAIRRAWGED